jgi:hypothetical protein
MHYQARKEMQKPKCILLREKGCLKKAIHCTILTVWPDRKGKTVGVVKRLALARVRVEGGRSRQNTEDFQGDETTPFDTIMADTCHYQFARLTVAQCQK